MREGRRELAETLEAGWSVKEQGESRACTAQRSMQRARLDGVVAGVLAQLVQEPLGLKLVVHLQGRVAG